MVKAKTPKHIRRGGSHYTDTSEPAVEHGANIIRVTVVSDLGFEPVIFKL
jgi:hypothetical protein